MTIQAEPLAPTKLDEYRAKILVSDAAADAATSERDRAFHRRASSIWRKLIHNIDEIAKRDASRPPPKPDKKAVATSPFKRT